jgi:hypothetical protein
MNRDNGRPSDTDHARGRRDEPAPAQSATAELERQQSASEIDEFDDIDRTA